MRHAVAYLCLVTAMVLMACTTLAPASNHTLRPGTDWVANSSGWREEATEVFTEATVHVEALSVRRLKQSWAVVLDLDETVLNNVTYQLSQEKRGEGYTPDSWFKWTQQEQAILVPGAADFIYTVNRLGGHVAFVTNRRDSEQLATENNLASLGFMRGKDFRILLTRASPDGKSGKSARFMLVSPLLAAQGYPSVETVVYIGDNKGDKPARQTGWSFFCIDQGAMYGDPCALVPGPGR